MRSSLYNCDVVHRRFRPGAYGFHTRMFMWLLDLDELPLIEEEIPIFGYNRRNVYAFFNEDHLYLGSDDLRENLARYLARHDLAAPARTELLTSLRVFGYVFNPVSFYFCYDAGGSIYAMVAEVHNTFGELKPFLVRDPKPDSAALHALHDKYFYISPFSDLNHKLELELYPPGERLRLHVNDWREGEESAFFKASLTGRRAPLDLPTLATYSFVFPLVTMKVITLIHWHAFRLWRRGHRARPKSENLDLQEGIVQKKKQAESQTDPIPS